MAAVAEWLVVGLAAAAERDSGFSGQVVGVAVRVDEVYWAFHAEGSVLADGDFYVGHSCSPKIFAKQIYPSRLQSYLSGCGMPSRLRRRVQGRGPSTTVGMTENF